MPTASQQASATKLRALLDELVAVPSQKLAREELGPLSFANERPLFESFREILESLTHASIEESPEKTIDDTRDHLSNLHKTMRNILTFDPSQMSTPSVQVRDNLRSQLATQWPSFFDAASRIILWSDHLRDLRSPELQLAKGKLGEIQAIAQEAELSRKRMEDGLQTLEEEFRKSIGETAVSKHSGHFEEEAKRNRWGAWFWLSATFASISATLLYVVLEVLPYARALLKTNPEPNLLPYAIINFGVISLGYYVVILCGRNYAASRHNVVVNRHRVNALSTFREFIQAAETPELRAAILNRTTEAVFAPQESGYARTGPSPGSTSELSELLAVLASRTKA